MSLAWTKREPNGSQTIAKGLGLIEIYRAEIDGMCVEINGKRAWSCWRESENMIQIEMSAKYRAWCYLNSFK